MKILWHPNAKRVISSKGTILYYCFNYPALICHTDASQSFSLHVRRVNRLWRPSPLRTQIATSAVIQSTAHSPILLPGIPIPIQSSPVIFKGWLLTISPPFIFSGDSPVKIPSCDTRIVLLKPSECCS